MASLAAFTDGSCTNNGRATARGGWAVVWPDRPDLDVSAPLPQQPRPSNNRAEYTAVIRALQVADVMEPRAQVAIHTDCNLVIQSMTSWLPGWKRRSWHKADGQPVLNADLLQELDRLVSAREARGGSVTWHHVSAHTGRGDWASRWNAEADKRAREACETGRSTGGGAQSPAA